MDTLCFVVFLAAIHQASADCCCFPNQLQGIQSLSTKQDTNKSCTTVTGLYQFSFDLMKEEVYLEGTVYIKGKPLKQQVLQSYATGKMYYVANGRCIVVPLKKRLLRCVPSNAKPMLSTYSGIEKDVFGVDMYYFKEDGVQTTLTVMRRECVPIAEHLESCDADTDVNYYGLSHGIRNATQFAIPKACKKATEMSRIPEEMDHLKYLRFSSIFL